MLDFTAKSQLSDGAMTLTPTHIARDAEDVCVISPVIGEAMAIVGAKIALLEAVATRRANFVVVPLNLGNNHRCGLLIDMSERSVVYYDPLASSYVDQARDFALAVAPLLKETQDCVQSTRFILEYGRADRYYNCGIFVLLFAEEQVHKITSRTNGQCRSPVPSLPLHVHVLVALKYITFLEHCGLNVVKRTVDCRG